MRTETEREQKACLKSLVAETLILPFNKFHWNKGEVLENDNKTFYKLVYLISILAHTLHTPVLLFPFSKSWSFPPPLLLF
jgi:hypothetical protein